MRQMNRKLRSLAHKDWLTIREATAYLKVNRSTLYRWASAGRVRLYHLGAKTVRIQKEELDELAVPSRSRPRTRGTLVAKSGIWKLVGIAEGPRNLAAKHDRYLADATDRNRP